ncbi:MAG: exosortase E/protease, VPEID-CTERM system [Rhodobacteraceae bacterium]|nr:exosortase E/protease, VPEID-CTERM system [Paracoccaceae bacterium]
MNTDIIGVAGGGTRFARIALAVAFGILSLGTVTITFWYFFTDTCQTVALWRFCNFSREFGERSVAVVALATIWALTHPERVAPVVTAALSPAPVLKPLAFGFGGLLLATVPAAIVGVGAEGPQLLAAIVLWTAGILVVVAAGLRMVAPFGVWIATFRSGGILLPAMLLFGLALPELGKVLFPLWHTELLRDPTFNAVRWFSDLLGLNLTSTPEHFAVPPGQYVLGQGDFFVSIGQSCSGIEGFALISIFLTGYLALFRHQLSVSRAMVVLPIGLVLSWLLNVVRISVLIWLGVNVSPTLAVEGFHSHAGWLSFTFLAFGLIATIHFFPWFRARASGQHEQHSSRNSTAPPPLTQDWNAARILPFTVFMFTALLASTFFEHPAIAYPLRLVAMLAALWVFRAQILAIEWRIESWAVLSGAVIGVAWVLTAPAPAAGVDPLAGALGQLGVVAFALWVVSRVIGTTFVVPLIEELFFRSYLLDRLSARRSMLFLLLAVGISTVGFALLHGRWIAAGLAGLVFAWLVLRPNGKLSDAIVSHGIANGLIAAAAGMSGDWTMI